MSLQYVLLGMLREPASGYDLKQRFQESVQHFWAAELAQIYPLLNKMEKSGLLSSHTTPSSGGPPRKVYARTDAGLEALTQWLHQGPELKQERLSWLAQVFFLHELPMTERIAFMHELKYNFSQRLVALEFVEQQWQQEDQNYPNDLDDASFYPQLTLRLGIAKYRAALAWCDESIERITHRNMQHKVESTDH